MHYTTRFCATNHCFPSAVSYQESTLQSTRKRRQRAQCPLFHKHSVNIRSPPSHISYLPGMFSEKLAPIHSSILHSWHLVQVTLWPHYLLTFSCISAFKHNVSQLCIFCFFIQWPGDKSLIASTDTVAIALLECSCFKNSCITVSPFKPHSKVQNASTWCGERRRRGEICVDHLCSSLEILSY